MDTGEWLWWVTGTVTWRHGSWTIKACSRSFGPLEATMALRAALGGIHSRGLTHADGLPLAINTRSGITNLQSHSKQGRAVLEERANRSRGQFLEETEQGPTPLESED